jgi:hypothetical protein
MAQTHTPEESIGVRSGLLLTRLTIAKDRRCNNPHSGDFVLSPCQPMLCDFAMPKEPALSFGQLA